MNSNRVSITHCNLQCLFYSEKRRKKYSFLFRIGKRNSREIRVRIALRRYIDESGEVEKVDNRVNIVASQSMHSRVDDCGNKLEYYDKKEGKVYFFRKCRNGQCILNGMEITVCHLHRG